MLLGSARSDQSCPDFVSRTIWISVQLELCPVSRAASCRQTRGKQLTAQFAGRASWRYRMHLHLL